MDEKIDYPSDDVHIDALILARGCSKSIARKNVKNFLTMPLVCHTVKVALECNRELISHSLFTFFFFFFLYLSICNSISLG